MDSLAGDAGEWLVYEVEVPWDAGALEVSTFGGAGDADLYVRQGEAPTEWEHACVSQNAGNDELCTIEDAEPGTWFVAVYGYTAFSDLTLGWEIGAGPVSGSLGGLTVTDIDVASGQAESFPFEVPAMAARVTAVLSGGIGDADLRIDRDGVPVCVSENWGNDEECVLDFPWEGELEIFVIGTQGASGVTLEVTTLIGDVPDW